MATPTAVPNVVFTPGVLNTVQLTPGKDNTLYQDDLGSSSNGQGEGLFAGTTNNGSIRRALLAFDIRSVVPEGAIIESVELTLSVTRTTTDGKVITLHLVTSDWGEGGSNAAANEGGGALSQDGDATWVHTFSPDQMWQTAGGDFAAAESARVTVAGAGEYTWTSTDELVADVQAWLDDPSSNFGWILIGDEGSNQTAKRFASSEHSDEAMRPVLTVQFTPPN